MSIEESHRITRNRLIVMSVKLTTESVEVEKRIARRWGDFALEKKNKKKRLDIPVARPRTRAWWTVASPAYDVIRRVFTRNSANPSRAVARSRKPQEYAHTSAADGPKTCDESRSVTARSRRLRRAKTGVNKFVPARTDGENFSDVCPGRKFKSDLYSRLDWEAVLRERWAGHRLWNLVLFSCFVTEPRKKRKKSRKIYSRKIRFCPGPRGFWERFSLGLYNSKITITGRECFSIITRSYYNTYNVIMRHDS